MEYIIWILILFVLMGGLLKLSFWQWWQAALFGLICAVFTLVTCRWAVMQSKTQWADFFEAAGNMQNVAVWITFESVLCFAFCFAELCEIYGLKKGKWQRKLLYWYPGLLLFFALFYLQTQLIFSMPGTGFRTISCVLAVAVCIGFPLLSHLLKYLYPERELRLEVFFLVSLLICVTGLIATVNGDTAYSAAKEPLNIKAVALSIGLFIAFFMLGIAQNKIKWKIKNRKNGNYL